MYSGTKVPVNGAVPVVMEVSAESSKTVLTKFWLRSPPTAENSGICRPVRCHQDRGEAGIQPSDAMLSVTVMSAILRVLSELTVNVESSVPGPAWVAAGIDWSTGWDRRFAGR